MSKTKKVIGWVLASLITAMMVFSAIAKFANPEMAANFAKAGLGDWLYIIAIGELISVLLFILPKTNRFGVLLMSSYLGGAILLHMSHGEPFIIPAVLLVLVWVTGYLRNLGFLL